mgnify:CR=1 FL=1
MSRAEELYSELLDEIRRLGTAGTVHLVAFSGGVDSSLAAKAVHAVYPGSSEAIMALSPSVSRVMKEQAEDIADRIGIPLRFVRTEEYNDPLYVANEGKLVCILPADRAADGTWERLVMPTVPEFFAPILFAIPAQLLAYHTAVAKGTDVDQPRNLAKSVTVE